MTFYTFSCKIVRVTIGEIKRRAAWKVRRSIKVIHTLCGVKQSGTTRAVPYPLVEKVKIAESEVVEIWKSQLLDRAELATEGGKSLRIIYPGRVNNDGQGADFRDAVIIINQKVTKGDIEIHTKSSAWRAHRHYDNPAYNQVILHVVMWHDTAEATILQNREIVPVLSLEKYIKNPIDQQN